MTSSDFSHGKHALVLLAAMLLVAFGVVAVSPHAQASEDNKGRHRGGGGGVSIGIDIGGVIDTIQREQERQRRRPTRPVSRPRSCPVHMVWSRRSGRCVCSRGYTWSRGSCRRPPTQVKKPRPRPQPEPVVDVVLVQECLNKTGFDAGPADGKPGRKTTTALRDFQLQNGLSGRPLKLGDEQTLAVLFDKCDDEPQVATAPPPVEPPAAEPALTRTAAPVAPAQSPARCLPQDLHDLLARTYGGRPAIAACQNSASICLPKPLGYTQAKLQQVSASSGVNWCENCVQLGSWLPLRAVLAIEQAANITLCASPMACYLPGQPAVKTQTAVRTIFRTLPRSVDNEGDIAVIVGNETYNADDVPANPNGNSDADAVRTLLVEQLGFSQENIIDLRDATLADLERVFGDQDGAKGELAERLGTDQQGDVFVYVSSHGIAQEDSKQAYLLPVDVSPDEIDASSYPLQRLYGNLGKLGARSIMMFLEADFARDVGELVDPPNLPELSVNAMPETPVPGLAVFKASDRDQRTLEDPEYGIGLFTRYLIEGLAGKADEAPIGNTDNRIDAVELFVYTSDLVRTSARKSFGVEQKPLLSEIGNLLVGQLAK